MDKLQVGLIPLSGFVVQRGYLRVVDEETPIKSRAARESIVDDFCDIVSADGVLDFARTYGFMGTADGRLPARESIKDWLDTAAKVRAMVKAAEYINDAVMPPANILDALSSARRKGHCSLGSVRSMIAAQVNALIARSGLRPQLEWSAATNAWTLGLSNSPVYWVFSRGVSWGCLPAIAYFTIRRVMNRPTSTYCSICGEEVFVSRARPSNRAHYCDKPECRTEMWRRLKQRQRAKAATPSE